MTLRWEVLSLTDRKKTPGGKIFLRLLKYILHFWPLALLGVTFSVCSNLLALRGPVYLGNAVDAIAAEGGVQMDAVWYNFFRMLLCYGASAILAYLLTLVMVNLSQRVTRRMRRELFCALTGFPVSYFDSHPTGDIVSRFSYDIDTVNSTLSTDLVQVLSSVVTVVGSLVMMVTIAPPLLLVFALTLPISILFTKKKTTTIQPLFRKRSAKLGELNGFAEEMLSGAKTIGAYHREEDVGAKFDQKNKEAADAYYEAEYLGVLIGPSVNFINNLSLSLIMIFGGVLFLLSQNGTVAEGSLWFITIGGISKFVMYSRKFAGPINEFANILSEFQSAFTAAERIFRIMDEAPETADKETAKELENAAGEVTLQDVSFGYLPGKTVLHHLSFGAMPGQTVAIVGPTGAGKTTVINLLMRFYDPDGGEITVDGKEIRDLTRDSLRKAYTMVLQDTWLFHGTVLENITYGKDGATREEAEEAAKAARIHGFISRLPNGYDTLLSDDGVNISKGQKQLITIARAMLADSRMLILDEATSNVDSRTEQKIQEAMNKLMEGRTCFIIAHRLSTIQHADLILVVKEGNVIEQGTHEELLAGKGFYASLYNSQFS